MINATLVLLLRGHPVSEVLLGYKKIGFGQGKYTGFGGKIEHGEGVVEAALRELTEETGLTVPDPATLKLTALLEFRFPHQHTWNQNVYVLTTRHWQGTLVESNEMIPRWFSVERIPYEQMWEDDELWFPLLLRGRQFSGRFIFDGDAMISKEIREVELFD